ncbi:hypothetical protein CORC01_12934 [Colletotrichum orchidophilum]|uniref:Uncharacterized protein n=1 Tax=Colletotrichum orchidophilum TaxID=1209926 RepID=A0A1G4ARH7_9PEZI|nr:uncharacterized protein CORC01_12934 [Colletotrichum orchidophilum]OHE91760.1 hypothetical protein CORC01_12934 [Colletotrichum orchidophilum]
MDQQDDREATSRPKGKGKEASTSPSSAIQTAPNNGRVQHQQGDGDAPSTSSFASRLTASAASLSRAALTARPATETILNEILRVKLSPGTSSSSAQGSGSHRDTATYRSPSSVNPGTLMTFNSSPGISIAGGQHYEDFMAARAVCKDPSQLRRPAEDQGSNSGTVFISEPSEHNSLPSGTKSDCQEQEARDGLDVGELLNSLDSDGHDATDNDLQTFISPQEEASLRRALFDDSHGRPVANWARLLDFQPHFLEGDNITELVQHFGVDDVLQARAMWMESWNDVLTGYTDEVWGDFGSLAREAHQEIEEACEHGTAATTDPSGMQALQRLRQILAHVRGH